VGGETQWVAKYSDFGPGEGYISELNKQNCTQFYSRI